MHSKMKVDEEMLRPIETNWGLENNYRNSKSEFDVNFLKVWQIKQSFLEMHSLINI